MIPAHSTVPRWAAVPPTVDVTGRSYVLVAFGAAGSVVAAGWGAELAARGAQAHVLTDSPDLEAIGDRLRACLEREHVGVRLMVAGPEQEVLATCALADELGLGPTEIVAHATSAERRRVYCAHCTTTTSTPAEVGEVVSCRGCARELVVFAHVSAASGSYLGFLAAAEELAWT